MKRRQHIFPIFLLAAMVLLPSCTSRADSPCPVMLVTGSTDADGISLSFRNKGKLPIQMLDFSCASTAGSAGKPSSCHTETGLFFPGGQYTTSFLYAAKKKTAAVSVSVADAHLSDGSVWRTTRRQPCKPLRITARH